MSEKHRKLKYIEKDLLDSLEELREKSKNQGREARYIYDKRHKLKYAFYDVVQEDNTIKLILEDLEMPSFNNRYLRTFDLQTSEHWKFWNIKIEPGTYMDSNRSVQLPQSFKKFIQEYQEAVKYWKNVPETDIKILREDENNRVVALGDWQKAYNDAETERSLRESRAVIIGGRILCINASAAIEHLPEFEEYREQLKRGLEESSDPRKQGDKLYKACERGHWFKGHTVEYASKEVIKEQINIMEAEL
jgi:hypothetical protein